MKVAFIVGVFPAISETWLINQIADLLDRGVDIEIFAFQRRNLEYISQRYYDYHMADRTYYLEMPRNRIERIIHAVPKLLHLLMYPKVLRKVFRPNLRFLFWAEPFVGKKFDLVHCHFGTLATDYLIIKDIVGIPAKIITTCYGYDVSKIFHDQPADVYDRLIKESSRFIAMSNNMKERMISHGFPSEKIDVLPISIDTESYPFAERTMPNDGPVHITTVGRFVEKKGYDDLFRALAIVKEKCRIIFQCSMIGGGEKEAELRRMVDDLGLRDRVQFKGYMKIEDIIPFFLTAQLFVQPSKTAKNGDME